MTKRLAHPPHLALAGCASSKSGNGVAGRRHRSRCPDINLVRAEILPALAETQEP